MGAQSATGRALPPALAFQSDFDRIAREKPPAVLRCITLALAMLLIGTVILASVARVDIVVSGHGRLAADRPTNVVMPLDRAILRTLHVRAGDTVHRGDVLATLDSTFTQADLTALADTYTGLVAEAARLRAELDGAPFQAADSPQGRLQARLYDQRLREYRARMVAFDQTLAHDMAEADTTAHAAEALRHQADIATEVLALRQALMQRAVGSRLQYLDADGALSRARSALKETLDRQAELQQAMLSHRADQRAFAEEWRRDVIEKLAAQSATMSQARAALDKAARAQDLVVVRAPEDGTVLDVAARGPGAVLREAEPLLTLLPARAGLIADITVKSSDIGFVRAGDAATLKVDAYPYQRHGALPARIRSIAAASFEPQGTADSAAVHRLTLTLDDTHLAGLPPGTGPMPGMTISADVRVGSRTVLAYFLGPLTRGFAESLREP